jgi:hypothetical protein
LFLSGFIGEAFSMFYDVEKDTAPEVWRSHYGTMPRRVLRMSLYVLDVPEAVSLAEQMTREGEQSAWLAYNLYDEFISRVVSGMRERGERELQFPMFDLIDEPFDLPGFPRGYYKQGLLDEYERVVSCLVPLGWLEQMEALGAGVPLEYVFSLTR